MHILRPIQAEGLAMYMIRCDFTNGLHREYLFDDFKAANDQFQLLELERRKEVTASVVIYDQCGRQAVLDCRNIQCLELVEIPAETVGAIKLVKEVTAIQQKFGAPPMENRAQQRAMVVPEDEETGDYRLPAIGRAPAFSS